MADSALKTKTTHSLFWSFIDKFGQQILNFVSMLVLMNIVAPDAYGLIGSLAVFTAFSTILIDSGFGRALLNRKEISATDYSSVFYFNAGLSIFLYLILFFLSPFIAVLFNAPALVPVSRVIFLALIFNAFGSIHYTILIKRANFREITKMNMLALLIADIVAIAMALTGYGVWALVVQIVLFAFFRTILFWFSSSWRPVAEVSLPRLKSFFGFSYKLMLSSMISTTVNNIYPSLIAVFYPMSHVAFFNQAKKYQEIPFLTFSNTFRSVAMLILSEINDQTERLKRVVRKLIKSIAFLSFPIALVMILIAEPTFYLFFQEKWLASVPYFQVLTLAGMFLPFTVIFNELFIAKERSAFFLGLEVVKGIVLILLIVLFFPKGIMGLAVSWVVYMIVTLILSMIFSGKVIQYSLFEFMKDIFPYLLGAVISTAISYFFTRHITNDILFILVNPVLIASVYITLCKLFKVEMTKEIDEWFASRKKTKV
ncbi:lipopolysaccharide biosynthesis protein [uncultured Proteiniphilum sp.]|uniref:lipopolysaccharide biosynthesis protein n=1 Tax=uncultured Proteiniphilum sp. TaxID=497637 RepID=UPI00261E7359|nr:lipopolysaccharide biosynthesis protein [uncultured Proteiniphilum sp.]